MEENKIEKEKPTVEQAGIDQDVLDEMVKDNILKATTDDTQMNRAMLNCLCEMLSQFKQMNKAFEDFSNMISICGADKLVDFFSKLKTNVNNEVARQNVEKEIKKSHKKSQKGKSKDDKIVKFPSNDVK